jgi:hypothetical protein
MTARTRTMQIMRAPEKCMVVLDELVCEGRCA